MGERKYLKKIENVERGLGGTLIDPILMHYSELGSR